MTSNTKSLLPPEAGRISPDDPRSHHRHIGFHSEQMLNTAMNGEMPTASNMRAQMIEDFQCTKPSEKLLVDTIIADYVLATELQEELNCWRNSNEYSDRVIKIISMFGKQLDMTRRRLQSEYQTLIALKKPAINVNIKAKNAVIGQNQQFNANSPQGNQ